jgi:circadian clock protein KaiC
MAAARDGEPVLYVTLSETEDELRSVAESHGWVLDGIGIRELTPSEGGARSRSAEHDVPPGRVRTGVDDQLDPR